MKSKSLDKIYDPINVENKWYAYWMEHKMFHVEPEDSKPRYTIVIPPPNVTGMLTMGHILNNTLQDLLTRWKRMQGYDALWLPGTDHAGIATQNKVEAALKKENLTRQDLGREKLIERVWEWKKEYGGIILKQLRKLGASCDWERERFTMDEGLSRAVREVFIRLYEKGLIYRGHRLINWCPRCQTALASEEAQNREINGKFWSIAYKLEQGGGEIVVSTTRPETLLGDTAVAVHPDDPRYTKWIGKNLILPLLNRRIPVIADAHADPEKGSGAVKITPAHDFEDFEVGIRHGLEQVQVIDESGRMNENAGPYRNLDRFKAREKILEDLQKLGLLRGEEPRLIPVPHCYRCDTVIEPSLSDQWFVKMKPLAEPAIAAVKEGEIRFHPKHWEETYFRWMENIQDWCISRQIWWGHRIPVWTCSSGHRFVSREQPHMCPECRDGHLEQDPDVLDTWFSSWLWPFSTLGWPDRTEDLRSFFPTDTLVTGPDIIFFWVARMIMASLEFMGDVPFHDVYFNGMIRDMSGRKMSKSLGNSPDPLWLIDGADSKTTAEFAKKNPTYKDGVPAYGADAVRMTMVYLTPHGGDIFFDHKLVEFGQKFCNKLWNASRFVLMNLENSGKLEPVDKIPSEDLDITDLWIMSRLHHTIADILQSLENFRFDEATRLLYDFIWGEFCDWYLEMVKPRLYEKKDTDSSRTGKAVMLHVLESVLLLTHPFMPFITEEIWQALPGIKRGPNPSLMKGPYPQVEKRWMRKDVEKEISLLQKATGIIRTIRSEMEVPPDRKAGIILRGPEEKCRFLERHRVHLNRLAGVSQIQIDSSFRPSKGTAMGLAEDLEIFVPLGDLIDVDAEKEKVRKEILRLESMLEGLKKKLSNSGFVQKAPGEVIQKEKQKQSDFQEKVEKLKSNLRALEGDISIDKP